MARKPKDTAPLTRSVVSSGTLTDNRGNAVTSTTSATVERDYRPFYPYGSIVSLGSRLWRKPTAYYHASRKVELNGDAFIKQGATQASAWTNLIINPDADSMISSSSYGGYPLSTSSTAITETSLRNRAEVKALSSISEQKAGVGEDLATFSQVIEMFHSKASALEAALRFFKEDYRMHRFRHITQRFLRKGYKTFPKDLSELFLEYVYGWKPLVSDLYGTIELLREYSKGVKPIILHGHGQATDTKSRSWAKENPVGSPLAIGLSSRHRNNLRFELTFTVKLTLVLLLFVLSTSSGLSIQFPLHGSLYLGRLLSTGSYQSARYCKLSLLQLD